MMDNYDSNMIKPIDGLQNISGLAPTRRREQRKRRENLDQEGKEQQNMRHEEEVIIELDSEPIIIDDADESKIDYRA